MAIPQSTQIKRKLWGRGGRDHGSLCLHPAGNPPLPPPNLRKPAGTAISQPASQLSASKPHIPTYFPWPSLTYLLFPTGHYLLALPAQDMKVSSKRNCPGEHLTTDKFSFVKWPEEATPVSDLLFNAYFMGQQCFGGRERMGSSLGGQVGGNQSCSESVRLENGPLISFKET